MGEADVTTETPAESEEKESMEGEDQAADQSGDDDAVDSVEESTEEPTEEVENPETAPENPAESDVPEDEVTLNSTEVNEAGDTYTVTIANYATLKNQVKFTATVGSETLTRIPSNGQITVTEEAGSPKATTIKVEKSDGYKITGVTNGSDPVTAAVDGSYTIGNLTADTTITVTTVATYKVSVAAGAYGIQVNTGVDADNKPTMKAIAAGGNEDLERGALEFTVTGYTATDNDRLKVYYIADGSDDDDLEDVTVNVTDEGKKTTYSVPAATINSLDESIQIVIVKEEKGTVTIDSGANVDVQYWGKKNNTATDTDPAETWVIETGANANNTKYDKITTAFVGDTFKFKAVGKDPYVVSKVMVGKAEIPVTQNGEYSVTVTKEMLATTNTDKISFEAAFDSAKSRTLTYTLTGDKGSATATIISVTPAATTETPNLAATADAEAMKAALGIDNLTLESGETLSVLSAPTEIKVKIHPAADYELTTGTSGTIATEAVEGIVVGDSVVTITGTAAATITAVTQDVAVKGTSKYFKPGIADSAKGAEDNPALLSDLVVQAETNVVALTGEKAGVYEVREGARTVTFTVKAKEGFKVKDFAAAIPVKSVTAGTPAADGSVVYTVTLAANKLTGTEENPQGIEVDAEAIVLKAEVEAAKDFDVYYDAAMEVKGTAEDAGFATYTSGDIDFGSAFRATITPKKGCRLDEVSYVMGTGASVIVPVDEETLKAEIEIAKMTGDVKITVKSGKELKLDDLVDVETAAAAYKDPVDGIYAVEYGKKYAVGVKEGGADVLAKDVSVVVKDESGAAVAMTNPIVTVGGVSKRTINLASKNLAGQEITAEVSYKGALVGTYIMSVEKKTTTITVNGGEAIEQSVDSVKTYDLTTDGELENVVATVDSADSAFKALIDSGLIEVDAYDGKLQVYVAPADRDAIANKVTDDAVTTWPAKKATITVAATDVDDVEASVDITLTPLFNEDAAPTVSLVDAANNVLNVKVDMADVAAPRTGSVWYEVTATARPGVAEEGKPAPSLPADLNSPVTKIVSTADSRVALKVSNKELGAETSAWEAGYDVTAKLVYVEDESKPSAGVTAGNGAVAVSKEGKLEGATTKTPLFEDALKLKKAPGAPAKLYTGQTEDIVIAVPQWTKKFNSYQILSDNVSDNYYYDYDEYYSHDENEGLPVSVNADGNIVVKGVPAQARLGKHTITVVATADMSTGHTMYASRATITVNVVKGINKITVTQPSESIYKDPKKAGTLKLGVEYNVGVSSSNGSKWITAPASKKVTWSIVDAGSDVEYGIIPAPAYLKVGDTKNGVNVKNGTVTVAKGFTRDERHANNNKFKVLVEAADFAGNTTKALSREIEITADALDISTLVIVHANDKDEEVVTAVHDIKDKKAVSVLASDVDTGYIYALPANADVAVGTKWTTRLGKSAMPLQNLTMTTTNKKVLTVGDYYYGRNYISVLAAGKKAGIKVVANDGSKKTHTMNLTLDYKATEGKDLALSIGYRKGNNDFGDESDEILFTPAKDAAKAGKANETPVEVKLNTTGAARLDVQLYVGDKADGTSTKYSLDGDVWATNYKLTVKGGKAISNANGRATIVTTAKETTLTLTDQTKEAKAAKKKAYVYKIVNEAYDNTKLAKAPKVTVKGSLYAYGTVEEQNKALQLTVLDAANKNAPYAKDKTVKVELDWSARTDKNEGMLNDFAYQLCLSKNGNNTAGLGETGTISLFGGLDSEDDNPSFYVGSYKLKVTVGRGEGDKFVAETLPATVTVKVAKLKAFTFKPTTSYTINKVDGGAVLTGKANLNAKAGELLGLDFYNLQNVNLKGKSNKFTHYFMIASDEKTGTQRLTLNTNDPLVKAMIYEPEKDKDGNEVKDEAGNVKLTTTLKENPVINIPKEDLTGYITYYAEPSVNYYANDYVYGTVKITVKIAPEAKAGKPAKASQKYTTNNAEVALESGKSTEMNVIVNGSYVSIAYALVDDTKKGNAEELAVDLAGNAKGQIVLKTTKAVEEGKTYSTNLLIVPYSSFYKQAIDNAAAATAAKEGEAAAAATKQDLIKKYGIAVKVSVLASKNPAKTPDPTGASGNEPAGDQDVSEAEQTALESAAKAVTITKDDYTVSGETVTITEASITTKITNAIKRVDGWADATVTVDDITVTKAPTVAGPGEATATITVKREGSKLVTLQDVELTIEKLNDAQGSDPDDGDDT